MPPMIATGAARMSGHGVATTRIASTRSESCVANQETPQRRLAGLSRAHELDDSRVLALGRERGRPQPEHSRAVERAAHDMRARRRINGRRLTGERRDVEV